MQKSKIGLVLTLLVALALSACGGGEAEATATPTLSVEQAQTMAVMTFQAQLTQTARALPSSTPFPTNTPMPVVTFASPGTSIAPLATNTTVVSSGGASSTCYGLSFVNDVTIPDGTKMTPGQSFTKTWKVLNSGSCAWEAGFTWNIVGGEAMSGVAVTLNQRIESGNQFEFSVPMVAPTNKTGTLRGTWRLADSNNNFFGDSPWVEIVVEGTAATSYPNP